MSVFLGPPPFLCQLQHTSSTDLSGWMPGNYASMHKGNVTYTWGLHLAKAYLVDSWIVNDFIGDI